MNTEKQIAEMAVMGCRRNPQAHEVEECLGCEFKKGMCDTYRLAETLYNAGYRKTSESVKEIFNDIAENFPSDHDFNCSDISLGYVWALAEVRRMLAKIRHKYEEYNNETKTTN